MLNYSPPQPRGSLATLARTGSILMVFIFTAMAFDDEPQGDIERRVNDILSRMTLDEKIGQMSQSTSMATPLSAPFRRRSDGAAGDRS